jgi:nucleoside-diphosphate-sugar epimerase
MRVVILGIDGYLGWSLAVHLSKEGYEVSGCDNFLRRKLVYDVGSQSATPIKNWPDRYSLLSNMNEGKQSVFRKVDICNYNDALSFFKAVDPEVVVHFAQMPSAPYSMKGVREAVFTHQNNVIGNLNVIFAMKEVCPKAHLVKLGTMGEYGTPGIDISEGDFEVEYHGRKATLPYPKQPGSFYHCTKVHDSVNIQMACRFWGLRVTDIMQGVVFGVKIKAMGEDEDLMTRFDFDECFGTAINRFCAQVVLGFPITPYGKGGQNRGFLAIQDSINCINLIIDNPPDKGKYRVINQFEDVYNLFTLALMVKQVAKDLNIDARVTPVDNPRIEEENHYYNPIHNKLSELGYHPSTTVEEEVKRTIKVLKEYEERISRCKAAIEPKTKW